MTIKEAAAILDQVIHDPSNKMVDAEHSQIAHAWKTVKEYITESTAEHKKSKVTEEEKE